MKSDVRWVGFDMDECIGSVMPLSEFIHELRDDNFLQFLDEIYESEITGRTWLFRPAIVKVLRQLWSAYKRGAIQGAFIFSNNGSEHLVKTVMALLNHFIQRIFSLDYQVEVFQMGVHYGASCRRGFGDIKSYEVIQHCLTEHKLPLCTSPEHLLFFDDLEHVLQSQIPHYVRVPAYFNHTDVSVLADTLMSFGQTQEGWDDLVETAVKTQQRELKEKGNLYVLSPQDPDSVADDEVMFRKAFHDFLGTGKFSRINRKTVRHSPGKTRKMRRRL
jgi:hypothetical protein